MISEVEAVALHQDGVTAPEMPTEETAAPVADIAAPVVFQCSHCRTIVGDSSTIAHMDSERRTMSIKRKIDTIEIDPILNTSTREFDFGSTYQYFCCAQCKNVIGQVYITTSAKLDHLRELYTYHSEHLIFYQLYPDADMMQMVAERIEDATVNGSQAPLETLPAPMGPIVNGNLPSDMNVQMEIVKLQKFCLYLLEKLQKLEPPRKKRS